MSLYLADPASYVQGTPLDSSGVECEPARPTFEAAAPHGLSCYAVTLAAIKAALTEPVPAVIEADALSMVEG